MTFGQKLKYIREEILDMTQLELGASIGFRQSTINSIEKAKNKQGSFELVTQLVLVHNVNPYYFIYENSNESPILKRQGTGTKPLLQKIAKYEKLITQMEAIKNGK